MAPFGYPAAVDQLDNYAVKVAADYIAGPLHHVITLSLMQQKFPQEWKFSIELCRAFEILSGTIILWTMCGGTHGGPEKESLVLAMVVQPTPFRSYWRIKR